MKKYLFITLGVSAFTLNATVASLTPEMEALKIAPLLKPIHDDEWQSIAKDRIAEKYAITPGDTLYDISKRLFGDAKYWPKIWAINNYTILNPHMIRPGRAIAFMPGSTSSLPSVTLESTAENDEHITTIPGLPPIASDVSTQPKRRKKYIGKSQEWRNLPRQNWENVQVQLPPGVDPLGFDKNNKISFGKKADFELDSFVSSAKLDPIGKIKGSQSETSYLSKEDIVFIESDQNLSEGSLYTVTHEPTGLQSSGRDAYSYPILGTLQITQHLENSMYLAKISNSKSIINRESFIIPLQPRVQKEILVPGPSALDGHVVIDHSVGNTYASAQFKQVYIDRGTEDGISVGMVFQAYKTEDPISNEQLTDLLILEDATFVVVQAVEQYCTAIIVKGHHTIADGTPVTLLTDVSKIYTERKMREEKIDVDSKGNTVPKPETDELDLLDQGGELSPEEEKELRQLELWENNPPEDTAPQLQEPPAAEQPNPTPAMDEEIPLPEEETPPPAENPSTETPSAEPITDDAVLDEMLR